MNILVIGGGGREHAVCHALSKSPKTEKLWCAPGNGGTASICENVAIAATDIEGILQFCRKNHPGLVVVTPDDPLAIGMVDALENEGFAAFGPTRSAARLESSKHFAKEFMKRNHIPTAKYEYFENMDEARGYLCVCPLPTVIKKDGLAQGKGVVICNTRAEALDAFDSFLQDGFSPILVEEFLTGPEVSVLCFTDGKVVIPMPASQDHKRAFDGDNGPNTGGMGAFSPVSVYDGATAQRCMKAIFEPTVLGMSNEGYPLKGVLYFSLMLTENGPMVIEYNARFGDPETQVVLPLLQSDLPDIMMSCRNGTLASQDVRFEGQASCCVVAASGGYPGSYKKGFVIKGISDAENVGCLVYHAGTKMERGGVVTCGGRVLGICAKGQTLRDALKKAYQGIESIDFDGVFYRRDIGKKDSNA